MGSPCSSPCASCSAYIFSCQNFTALPKIRWKAKEGSHHTHGISLRARRARNRLLGILPGAGHAGDEWFVTRNDVDEKVKLIGFAQRLCDVGARQGATFV